MLDNNNSDDKQLGQGWDEAETIAAQAGNWIKLDAGQTVQLNVASEPRVFEKGFTEPNGVVKMSTRFAVDAFVPGQGLKVWEMSTTTFKLLKRQRTRKGEDFGDALFLVERIGSGTDTKYVIDYERQLKPAELAERAAALGLLPGSAPAPVGSTKDEPPLPF